MSLEAIACEVTLLTPNKNEKSLHFCKPLILPVKPAGFGHVPRPRRSGLRHRCRLSNPAHEPSSWLVRALNWKRCPFV